LQADKLGVVMIDVTKVSCLLIGLLAQLHTVSPLLPYCRRHSSEGLGLWEMAHAR